MEETQATQGETSGDRAADPVPTRSTRRPGRRGPKTQQGKARVRLNAVRHGLCASSPVIDGVEQVEDWEAHRAALLKDLAPVGYLETLVAERIASLFWRLDRVAPYEASQSGPSLPFLNGLGGGDGLPGQEEVPKIVRQEAHLSRQLYQALHELEALQARRRGQAAPLARVDVHGLPESN